MSQTASKENFDILVAGAGTAGVCAAIQAARAGASVCLVEKNGIPGGTITAAGIAYPGIFHAWGKQVIAGIGWELVERTRQESRDPLPNLCDTNLNEHWRYQVQIDPVIFAALCDEEFEKAGVTVKYHTMIGAAETAADGVGLTLCGKDGLYPVFARRVIDCTGDAGTLRALVDLKKQTFETQEDKAFAVIKGHRKCFGEPESLIKGNGFIVAGCGKTEMSCADCVVRNVHNNLLINEMRGGM